MDKWDQLYNLAIVYIQNEMYEEGTAYLEEIGEDYPNFSEVMWALGLTYVLMGFPHQALQKWERIHDFNDFDIDHEIGKVNAKLPLYQKIYNQYNVAIALIHEDEFHKAGEVFEELLAYQREVPLPVDFYYGYILAKVVSGEEKNAFDQFIYFPASVRKSSKIQELGELLHQYLETFRPGKTLFINKPVKPVTCKENSRKTWYRNIFEVIKNA
ncbi:tetratricopeptide repeat protein [Neobacillus sp. LXY-4]|uniref:tetratricopeptide repeat protein n=1 Tax=Neobacillus sp. LXY-4 TaxID=3379826 RepID=UPI003EE37010